MTVYIRVLFIFILISISQFAQNVGSINEVRDSAIASRFKTEALSRNEGYTLLAGLCSIGPRLSGSALSLKAIEWIKSQMMMMGFDTVYLQPVMVPHWERGSTERAFITSKLKTLNKALEIAALGGSISAKGISCSVLEINSFDDLAARKEEIKSRIVFYNVPFDDASLNTFASYGKNAKYRVYGAIEAAKYGAAAVLVRSITSKRDNVPHTGVMAYRDSIPRIPGAAIGTLDADFLHEALAIDPELKVNLAMDCTTCADTQSYNVIGEIRGSDYPQKILLSGGHFDSWDKGEGAHDDGAGCIHGIESVLLFKRLGVKPRHTLRTVLFINEENGSRGSARYAALSDSLQENHIAAIESDRGGFLPQGFFIENNDTLLAALQNFGKIFEQAGISWIKKGGGGVDIGALKSCKARIGFAADAQRYFDVHHSDNDVIGTVHPRELELGSAAIATMLYLLDLMYD